MLKQLAAKAITLWGVVTLVFLLLHLVPGDPVDALLGEQAMPADREQLRRDLGLDLPLGEQYVRFIKGVAHGDLGTSLVGGEPVMDRIEARLPATGVLGAAAMLVAVSLGLLGGVGLAVARGWRLRVLDKGTLALLAVPSFCLGPLLIVVFAVGLGWFPVSGMAAGEGMLRSLVLPAVTLGCGLGMALARLLGDSLREKLDADFVRTVIAKGGDRTRQINHALRVAVVPVIVMFCLQVGMVLTGAVLTEAVFGWPGVGNLLVEAVQQRDYPVVQGCVLMISFVYMVMTAVADVLVRMIDPRGRTA